MSKITLLMSLVLVAAFVAGQSFFFKSEPLKRPVVYRYYKSFPTQVATCAPLYFEADSARDIPALKGWGHYQWKISSASDSVQFYFNQGISLYYAFHTIESIASFTKATHIDPDCAMAWYGKALAMGPTINYSNGYRAPNGALQAALKSKQLGSQCTPVEKALINAMQNRYNTDTSIAVKKLRTSYADAMEKVYQQYPNNADVVTLYADALLLLHPWDLFDQNFKAKPWTPKIRALLEHALAILPLHPGANHYYIHTMEASATPDAALKSAHIMDTLMPLVSHLTHMPSHIYIRTGDYQRGIKVNNYAVAGYDQYAKKYAPVVNGAGLYYVHNVHLKQSCAEMAGNYKVSLGSANTLKEEIPANYLTTPGADGNYFQYVYSTPILTYVRFGKWDEILNMTKTDTLAFAAVLQHFARGVAFSRKHQAANAERELKLLIGKMQEKSLKVNPDNFSSAFDASVVAKWILTGVIAEDQKQYAEAIAALKQAVEAEDRIIYNEPRDWPIPARQYLGNVLLKARRYSQAIEIFDKDLFINPNNGWSLTGLVMASQHQGESQALKQAQQRLNNAWKINDIKIASAVF